MHKWQDRVDKLKFAWTNDSNMDRYMYTYDSEYDTHGKITALKGKEHKNTGKSLIKVFRKLHILMQPHGNRILTYEDVMILFPKWLPTEVSF